MYRGSIIIEPRVSPEKVCINAAKTLRKPVVNVKDGKCSFAIYLSNPMLCEDITLATSYFIDPTAYTIAAAINLASTEPIEKLEIMLDPDGTLLEGVSDESVYASGVFAAAAVAAPLDTEHGVIIRIVRRDNRKLLISLSLCEDVTIISESCDREKVLMSSQLDTSNKDLFSTCYYMIRNRGIYDYIKGDFNPEKLEKRVDREALEILLREPAAYAAAVALLALEECLNQRSKGS